MDHVLDQLIESAKGGPQALESSIELNKDKITPELASAARQAFKQAISEQNGETAMLATIVASRLYGRLGDRINELRNQIDFAQMRFMGAQTAEEYSEVRKHALQLHNVAKSFPSAPHEFETAILAADCAFFAAEASTNGLVSADWLVACLQDLVVAIDYADKVEKDGVFLKFVSLLATAVDNAMSRIFLDPTQTQVEDLLKHLAPAVENAIPIDFEFPGDPEKTARVATVLTDLSERYGN